MGERPKYVRNGGALGVCGKEGGGGAAGKDVYMGESLLVILAVILQA